MESSPRTTHGIVVGGLLLLVAVLLGGCGTQSPVAPSFPSQADTTGADTTVTYTRANPPPFLTTSTAPGGLLDIDLLDLRAWYELVSRWVDSGIEKLVRGGRYELRFHTASLREEGKQIVIREWSPDVLEFELGPHGTVFDEPVDLLIDFAGTNADSTSANYDGSPPELYWFNEGTGEWDIVPGKIVGMKYQASLEHFSQYGLARGKSGW